jgi:chromosomal replication initiation ATPase DnaA
MKQDIFNQYVTQVAMLYRISEADMFTRSRVQDIVDARQMLFYLCIKRPIPIYSIKTYLAERGLPLQQTAIMNGFEKMEKHIKNDPDYSYAISKIEKAIKF